MYNDRAFTPLEHISDAQVYENGMKQSREKHYNLIELPTVAHEICMKRKHAYETYYTALVLIFLVDCHRCFHR